MDKPSFISLRIEKFLNSKRIVLEPGDNISITINTSDKKDPFSISGTNEKAQKLYLAFPDPSWISMESDRLKKDTSRIPMKERIRAMKEKDISLFRNLLEEKEISGGFYNLIEADRNCYYASLEARYLTSRMRDVEADTSYILSELKNIFDRYSPNTKELLSSSFWPEYANIYLSYKILENALNARKYKDVMTKEKGYIYYIGEAKKYFKDKPLEYFLATDLFMASFQENYQKELIALFDQFKKDYPASEFTKYIAPWVNKIEEFHLAAIQPYKETMIFIDDYENLSTLVDVVKPFKGKKIYIDVWATWCGPCKREFEYNTKLKELLKSRNTELLYISIDDESRDKSWKDMIKFYNLEGYHVRANKSLEADLRRIFDRKGSLVIPWYILIDEDGSIKEVRAKKPSELVK